MIGRMIDQLPMSMVRTDEEQAIGHGAEKQVRIRDQRQALISWHIEPRWCLRTYSTESTSQNVFFKMYFSKCISQDVYLKMYFSH